MSYQRRRYILKNLDTKEEIELNGKGSNYEPKNWDNSDFTIKRSTKNFSITTIASKELEFNGNGARFLINAYELNDVEANVIMKEYRFHPRTDKEYLFTEGVFDFSDYSVENGIVKIPFKSGGLNSLITSKQNDKFELDRNTDINGNEIQPLKTNQFAVINRPLELKSLLSTNEDEDSSEVFRMSYGATFRYGFFPIPLEVEYESDDNVLSVFNNQFEVQRFDLPIPFINLVPNGVLNNVRSNTFYYNNNIDKIINLSIDINLDINVLTKEDLEKDHLSIRLVTFTGADDPTYTFPNIPASDINTPETFPELEGFETLQNLNALLSNNGGSVNLSLNKEVYLKKGESLAIYLMGGGDFIESFGLALLKLDTSNIKATIKIEELSVRNDLPRRAKFAFNKDVGESIMSIITGDKLRYKSDFFTISNFKLTGLSTGKWIRGFSDTTLTTSFKEFIDNSNSLFNTGYNIEIINGKETLVHEPLEYFFRPQKVIVIPEQVSDVKRTVAKEFIYSTIKTGYKKPSGDNLYEEVNGLNEINTSNEYTTPITRVVKDYDIESPYRADSEGKELTLRKSIKIFPTEDYRTDKTVFNLDLKDIGTNIYEERTWQDDFEEQPKNVFSPDTLTCLRFTPFRNMKRHFWFLNSAFTKFTQKYIRYSNTRGNSELITKKSGEPEYKENGNYQIKSLENPIFVSEWIEFVYPVSFDLLDKINGFTYIDGKKIPNTYFKIQFINEFNKNEYGYLFELKPNKEGKWKVLKAL